MTTRPAEAAASGINQRLDAAIDSWAEARHKQVSAFVDANFRFAAALRLHRRAFGLDLLRAPANVALVPVYLLTSLTAAALWRLRLRRPAEWLRRRRLFLATDVARELALRLRVQLLALPGPRDADAPGADERDSLAEAILAEFSSAQFSAPADALLRHRQHVAARSDLDSVVETWTGSRTAAAELINSLMLASAGAGAFQHVTPGALSLGPLLAGAIAQHLAIIAFPLGATLGSLWYGVFAVQPSSALIAGAIVGLMLLGALLTAFAGVIADPLQRATGLHARRLHRLIDVLAAQLKGDDAAALKIRDHYAARIFDLADALGAAARLSG